MIHKILGKFYPDGLNEVLYWQFWTSFWDSWAKSAAGGAVDQPLSQKSPPAGSDEALRRLMDTPELRELAREQFLANVNHDLRTPLNAVIGFAQLIENQMFGEVPDQYRDYARHIQESGYDLLGKIETLIDQPMATCETTRTRPPRRHHSPARRAKKLAAVD